MAGGPLRPADPLMPTVAQVRVHFANQCAVDHHLGKPSLQSALPREFQDRSPKPSWLTGCLTLHCLRIPMIDALAAATAPACHPLGEVSISAAVVLPLAEPIHRLF